MKLLSGQRIGATCGSGTAARFAESCYLECVLTIFDMLGAAYAVDAKLVAGKIAYTAYTVYAGDTLVALAVLHPVRECVTDVLVYREADRRRGIASALYTLVEQDLGRPLRPSRIRSLGGRAFWASRRQRV